MTDKPQYGEKAKESSVVNNTALTEPAKEKPSHAASLLGLLYLVVIPPLVPLNILLWKFLSQ